MPSILSGSSSGTHASVRDRIINAAAAAFARDGFRASTVRQIALAANVNDVTVFRYFPQKRELYWHALDSRLRNSCLADDFRVDLDRCVEPAELLETLIVTMRRAVAADPLLPRLLQFAVLELDRERQLLSELHFQPLFESLLTRINAWISVGKLRRVDARKVAVSVVGVLLSQWMAAHLLGAPGEDHIEAEQLGAEYSEILFGGLRPAVIANEGGSHHE